MVFDGLVEWQTKWFVAYRMAGGGQGAWMRDCCWRLFGPPLYADGVSAETAAQAAAGACRLSDAVAEDRIEAESSRDPEEPVLALQQQLYGEVGGVVDILYTAGSLHDYESVELRPSCSADGTLKYRYSTGDVIADVNAAIQTAWSLGWWTCYGANFVPYVRHRLSLSPLERPGVIMDTLTGLMRPARAEEHNRLGYNAAMGLI